MIFTTSLTLAITLLPSRSVNGFHSRISSGPPSLVRQQQQQRRRPTVLFSSTDEAGPSDVEDANVISIDRDKDTEIALAREELIELSEEYQSKFGVLVLDPKKKKIFKETVERLERLLDDRKGDSIDGDDPSMLVGDWSLVCSAAYYPNEDKLEKLIPDSITDVLSNLGGSGDGGGPLQDIRDTLNDSVDVIQRIKCSGGAATSNINEVDHIIDYYPPNKLSSFVKNLPDVLSDLDINPLKVKETKVVLKHSAEIKQTVPNVDIKLILKSIVVNVAGESQILEPNGADVLGINIPFSEYLQAGSFETTVLDSSMRVSRSKLSKTGVEQIRVFRKSIDDNDGSIYEKSSVVATSDNNYDDDLGDDELAENFVVDVTEEDSGDDNEKDGETPEDENNDVPSDVN